MNRREFLMSTGLLAAGTAISGCSTLGRGRLPFRISLAEWSLHRSIRGGTIDHLDFARTATYDYGIDAVEYVSTLFQKGPDPAYVRDLRIRADDAGVRSLVIMCDGEGALGDPDPKGRKEAVENHVRWVEAAAMLGCHSIRVNAESRGTPGEQQKLVADGLSSLCAVGSKFAINVIVENHGGLSSDPRWLLGAIHMAKNRRAGTLPDFGNFRINSAPVEDYDRYEGVRQMMPYAKAVSAKSHAFDSQGNETETDFLRMMRIVVGAGYHRHVGIEFEGDGLSEHDGIVATKALLERVREQIREEGLKA